MTLSRCQRIGRWLALFVAISTCGGTSFLFSSCDPQVSSTLLTGFQDLSTTFVDAFFIALTAKVKQDQGTTSTSSTSTTTTTN